VSVDAEFRDRFARVAAWIEDYLRETRRYPVLSRSQPGDLIAALPAAPPDEGESFDAIFRDFERLIVPVSPTGTIPGSSPTSRSAPRR